MLKKYMIFGSVVLLLAALLTMTGCSQATDSDGTTLVIGENHLFGNADQDAVARAVASAEKTGRSVVISDGTVLYGVGGLPDVADFKDRPVRVEGSVTVRDGVIVNAAFATLTFAEGAYITVRNRGAFIYKGDDKNIGTDGPDPDSLGYKVRYVDDPLRGTQGTDEHVAISDYTIGADFKNIAPHITNLYVLGKLTIDAGSIAEPDVGENPRVIALGTVALEASNSLVFEHMDGHNFQFTDSAVLTSTVPSLTLTSDDLIIELPTIAAAVPLTIETGAITRLEIAGIKGPDTLTITTGGNALSRLAIKEVSEGGKVAVNTGTLGIGNGGVAITKNAGSISIRANDLFPRSKIEAAANTGTLTIAVPEINNAEVIVADNKGTINIDTPFIAGTYNPAPPRVYSGVYIKENTGEVNFLQNLGVSVDYGIRAPVNNGAINFYGTLTVADNLPNLTPPASDFIFDLGNGGSSLEDFVENIAGTGKVVFGGHAWFGGNNTYRRATNIDCDMVFNDGFTQSASTNGTKLGLGGDVTLANGQLITIQPHANTTTTLKEGKKLLVGTVPVLIGGAAGAEIKPPSSVTNLVLTAGIPVPDDEDDLSYKTLFVTSGGITSITGNLRIAGDGLLRTVAGIDTGVGGGSLTLEDGAILAFPTPTGASTVTFGGANISGSNGVEIDALGGAVTLGPDSISGSGATFGTPEEAPVAGGPTITAGGTPLLIAGVNLDLQFYGFLNIPNANSRVVLEGGTNPGKITLSEDTGTTFTSGLSGNRINSGDTPATTYADLLGSGLLLGDEQVVPCTIGEISGVPGGGRLTIRGGSGGSTIRAGLSVVE
jgi:hypothetical protein